MLVNWEDLISGKFKPSSQADKKTTKESTREIYLVIKIQTSKQFVNLFFFSSVFFFVCLFVFFFFFHLSNSSQHWQTGSFSFFFRRTRRRVDSPRISRIVLFNIEKFASYYGCISLLLHFLTTCNIFSLVPQVVIELSYRLINGLSAFFFSLFDAILELDRFLYDKPSMIILTTSRELRVINWETFLHWRWA